MTWENDLILDEQPNLWEQDLTPVHSSFQSDTSEDANARLRRIRGASSPFSPEDQAWVNKGYDAYKIQRDRQKFESALPVRMLRGVEAPAIKAVELSAEIPGAREFPVLGKVIRDVESIQPAREAGMKERYRNTTDYAGNLASAVPGLYGGGKIVGALAPLEPGAINGIRRVLAGMTAGGVVAGATPGSTLSDVETGAVLGGAFPAGKGTINKIWDKGKEIFTNEGRALRFLDRSLGKDNVSEVSQVLQKAQPTLNVPPSAAEAIYRKNLPAGSPVQAIQSHVFEQPGGASKVGGELLESARMARVQAERELEASTAPLREQAFADVDRTGGAVVSGLEEKIKTLMNAEGNRANSAFQTIANRLLESLEGVQKASGPYKGLVPAKELDTIRKTEINKAFADVTSNNTLPADKARLNGLIKKVQSALDDTMEENGGESWKNYNKVFSEGKKNIDDHFRIVGGRASQEINDQSVPVGPSVTGEMYNPPQKTSVGLRDLHNPIGPHPATLNPIVAIASYIPKTFARYFAAQTNETLAKILSDANVAGKFIDPSLRKVPSALLSQALMRYAPEVVGDFVAGQGQALTRFAPASAGASIGQKRRNTPMQYSQALRE